MAKRHPCGTLGRRLGLVFTGESGMLLTQGSVIALAALGDLRSMVRLRVLLVRAYIPFDHSRVRILRVPPRD